MGTFKDLKAQDVKEAREATGLGLMAIKDACKTLDTDDAILAGFYWAADSLAVSIKPESARHAWNLDRAKRRKENYLVRIKGETMNVSKVYHYAPRLLEIAKEYREHIVFAATEGEDMSLVDEIDKIIKEVEG